MAKNKNPGAKSKEAFFQYQLKSPAIYDFYEGEDPLDWPAIMATNPLLIAFQATYGRHGRHGDDKPDRKVAKFIDEAKAHGAKYGLYHFLTPRSIAEQATFYLDTVRSLGGFGDMEPIVDIEYEPDKKDKTAIRGPEWASQIKTFLDLIEQACGMKPMIYTSAKFWAFTIGKDGKPPEWTPQYRLWTAGYPHPEFVDKNITCPPVYLPAGWKEWAIWQYAEDGRFRKYPANDLNLVSPEYVNVLAQPLGSLASANRPTAVIDLPRTAMEKPLAGVPSFAVGDLEPAPTGAELTIPITVAGTPQVNASFSSPQVSFEPGEGAQSMIIRLAITIKLELTEASPQGVPFEQLGSGTEVLDSSLKKPGSVPAVPKARPPGSASVSTTRFAIIKHIPRDVLPGKFAPDTVTLGDAPKGDGKGKVIPIPEAWWSYIAKINSEAGLKYARSVHMMWINIDYKEGETPKAERITCGGNFISILGEASQHFRIDSFNSEMKTGDLDPARDNWFKRPELFFKAIAVNRKGDLINVARNLDVYFPLLNRKGDEVWIMKNKVEPFAALPVEVQVTAETLSLCDDPGPGGMSVGGLAKGARATVLEYRPMGASVWGRTQEGWIALLLAERSGMRSFPTNWSLATVGVIPPA